MRRVFSALLVLSCCAGFGIGPSAARSEAGVTVELNKLDTVGQGCRIYMVFSNASAVPLASYKPDLVFFGKDGVIAERLVVEGGPLPAGKTKVKLFDVPNLVCEALGRVLLNDIRTCDGRGMQPGKCLAMTETVTRTKIEFIK